MLSAKIPNREVLRHLDHAAAAVADFAVVLFCAAAAAAAVDVAGVPASSGTVCHRFAPRRRWLTPVRSTRQTDTRAAASMHS